MDNMTLPNISSSDTTDLKPYQETIAAEKDVVWGGRDVLLLDSQNQNPAAVANSLFSEVSLDFDKDITLLVSTITPKLRTIIGSYVDPVDYVVELIKQGDEIPEYLKVRAKKVKDLDLSKYSLTGYQVLNIIICFEGLKSLKTTVFFNSDDLSKSGLSIDTLENSLQKLEHLDISNMEHFSIYFRFFFTNMMKQLKYLNVSYTDIDDIYSSDLKSIAKLKNLEYLDITGCSIFDSGLRLLSPLKHLKTLNAYDTEISQEGVESICKKIPGLVVNYGLNLSVLETALPRPLKNIIGSYVNPMDYLVGIIKKEEEIPDYLIRLAKNTTYLDLSDYSSTGKQMFNSLKSNQLFKLLLCFNDLKSLKTTKLFSHDELLEFEKLQEHPFKSLQNIEHLDLSNMLKNVNDILSLFIDRKISLKSLNIRSSGGYDFIAPSFGLVVKFSELEHLCVSGSYIDDEMLKKLYQLKNLKTLDIHETRITESGIADIRKNIPDITVNLNLNKIDMSFSPKECTEQSSCIDNVTFLVNKTAINYFKTLK